MLPKLTFRGYLRLLILLSFGLTSSAFLFAQNNIFPSSSTPSNAEANDGNAIETGVKFRVTQTGYITGIRFYKGTANTGTHIGHLWSSTGSMLAEATFTGESSSGWQEVLFTTPVAITTGVTYTASYFSSAGYYAVTNSYFTNAVVNGPLRALADGEDGGNGVYVYTEAPALPINTFQASNYWVDIVFAASIPPTVTSVSPPDGATGVATNTPVTATFSEALDPSTVSSSTFQLKDASNNTISANVTYNGSTNTASLIPSAALAYAAVYTATITGGASGVKDVAGNPLENNFTWSFTTAADITAPTISSVTPLSGATGVSLNTAVTAIFSEDMTASTVSGSTFQLRNAANVLVTATVNYNASTHSVSLTPSAALTASTVYTATITGGASGVKDLAGNALVNNFSWSFTTGTADVTRPTVLSVSPPASSINISVSTVVSATFSEAMNPSTISGTTFTLKNPSGVLITATISYNAATNTASLTPSAALASSTLYTATIVSGSSGVKDVAGNALGSNFTWKFTTADIIPPTITTVTPANGATGTTISTTVTAIFSEAMDASTISNTTFQLRNAANTLITATVSYNASTKKATLTPSAVLANSTVYTATMTGGVSGVKDVAGNPLANDFTWSFTTAPDITPPTVSSVIPISNATNVSSSTAVSAVFSEPMNASTITGTTFQLKNSAGVLITATISYNAATNTAILTPSATLAGSTVFTATIISGASGVKDAAGNALAKNFTWKFTTAADVTPPVVTSVSPLNGATGVSLSTPVSAIFSEALTASTISGSTFQLRNAANVLITAAVTYNASTNTATLTPAFSLAYSTVYTVTIVGGTSGVKDVPGNALASNYTWSFTTVASAAGPNVSIFPATSTPAVPLNNDGTAIETGVKFRTTQHGFITGVRFYKDAGNTGTHIGHLWNSTGAMLAEATFTDETASGWQQVSFSQPVEITTGTTYIASYFSSEGYYAYTNPYFTTAVVNDPLRALASGEDGGNGVFIYTSSPAFPNGTFQSVNYWADVVFTTSVGPDVAPPTILSVSPSAGAVNISTGSAVTVIFNELIDATTVNSSTFEIRNSSNTLVSTTISYNASTNTVTLTPVSAFSNSKMYTVTVKSGSSGVKDIAGNALANDSVWSFTITDPPMFAPTEGPGGPILVISTSSNPFSRYPVEILRAEGLNQFAAMDISAVTATVLNNYDVVILGEMTVTSAQATLLKNWATAGGTLIAFKPSSLLTTFCGISSASGTLSDKYLLVNTASGPGAGIVNQTIQFHGTANLHTLSSGTTSLATLYSSATTATVNPAVTSKNVGTSGGRAIAFTYDLAKSIVYTRQGNPAWAGQKRDGQADPIRSDDLFFPDWIDFNKVAIPQADEQQRLLVNIILQNNLHKKPLPRFWYLPRDLKAAIVMTGDDHSNNGTTGRFNQYLTLGPNTPQDITDWNAVRGTSYIYPNTPVTNAQAVAFEAQGFEIALHATTNCQNFTPNSLENNFATQLASFASGFPGLSAPVTNRTHCLVWSDWATHPATEFNHGIRLDANYYYWPAAWIQNRPGMFTGSGMPMRFANSNGSLIDVYQATTQMTDESGIDVGAFCDAVLDKAIGTEGYYGVFTCNMHTDSAIHTGSNAIIASAQARQIPVISAKQMLTWLDERNNSFFSNITWNNNLLSFNILARSGANNLKAMLPVNADTGQLISITMNGNTITYTTQTIKGILYAFFPAARGSNSYVANYNGSQGRMVQPPVTVAANTKEGIRSKEEAITNKQLPAKAADKLEVRAIPNPSNNYFNLLINSGDESPVTIRVLNIFGQIAEKYEKINAVGNIRIGQSLATGTYFVEVMQGGQKQVMKIVKVN